MKKLSRELGMSFTAKDEFGMLRLLLDFRLFKKGRSKKISGILKEKSPMMEEDLRIFDYAYTIRTGKSSRTFRQTVFFIQSKELGLPHLYLRPENFFHKIGNFLGVQDINFKAFPEFSQQYWLVGEEEDRIRQSMQPEILHFFSIEKDWCLEGLNYYLILYKKNQLIQPGRIGQFFETGKELVYLLKEKNDFV